MQEYDVTLPSGMQTTLKLPDDEAAKRGLRPKAKAVSPENKQHRPANKAGAAADKRAAAAAKSFGQKAVAADEGDA